MAVDNEKSVRDRIAALQKEKGFAENGLAEGDTPTQKRLNRQLSHGAAITLDTLLRILDTYPDISAEWLLRGCGDRRYTYQDTRTGGHPSGSWPEYTYALADNGSGAELILHCSFTDPQNFTATSASGILPATLHFRHDNRALDANGDGILD